MAFGINFGKWFGGSSSVESESGDTEKMEQAKQALKIAMMVLAPMLASAQGGMEGLPENLREAAAPQFKQLTEMVAQGRVIQFSDSSGTYKFSRGPQGGTLDIMTPDGKIKQVDINGDGQWDVGSIDAKSGSYNIDRNYYQTGVMLSVDQMKAVKTLDWACFDATGKLVQYAEAPVGQDVSVEK